MHTYIVCLTDERSTEKRTNLDSKPRNYTQIIQEVKEEEEDAEHIYI